VYSYPGQDWQNWNRLLFYIYLGPPKVWAPTVWVIDSLEFNQMDSNCQYSTPAVLIPTADAPHSLGILNNPDIASNHYLTGFEL